MRLGILIAGSLYWRTEAYRVEWRSKHLNADASVAVNIPIRYGRLSSSQTYTMVYAPGCPEGLGKIMPCARLVSTAAEVIREAKALWVAEQLFGSRPNPQANFPPTGDVWRSWPIRTVTCRGTSSRNGWRRFPGNGAGGDCQLMMPPITGSKAAQPLTITASCKSPGLPSRTVKFSTTLTYCSQPPRGLPPTARRAIILLSRRLPGRGTRKAMRIIFA